MGQTTSEGHVEANGVRLWYDVTGGDADAPTVVLVQGVDGSALWWPPALVAGLAEGGLRVVRYDQRDVGLSTWVDGPFGVAELAEDLRGLLDGLGVARAHLVGLSMGGLVAQHLAFAHPERVASLVLATSTPGYDDRLPPTDESVFAGLDGPVENDEDVARLTLAFARAVAGSRFPFDEEGTRTLVAADMARGVNPASHHQGVVPAAPSRLDDLPSLRVPTLVVHGTEDPVFPFPHAEALAEGIPGAVLVRWDGVGHELPAPLMGELAARVAAHVRAAP